LLDARIAALDEMLEKRGGSYAVAVASTVSAQRRVARRLVEDDTTEVSDWAGKSDGIRNTPDILTGVLVGLLFVFVIVLGLGCLNSIQTPSQFAKVGPPSLKEW
jgi:hypothetical protein